MGKFQKTIKRLITDEKLSIHPARVFWEWLKVKIYMVIGGSILIGIGFFFGKFNPW